MVLHKTRVSLALFKIVKGIEILLKFRCEKNSCLSDFILSKKIDATCPSSPKDSNDKSIFNDLKSTLKFSSIFFFDLYDVLKKKSCSKLKNLFILKKFEFFELIETSLSSLK